MSRLYVDNVSSFGALNPITLASTTATTVNFLSAPDLPTIVAPDYLALTVQPDTTFEEIIYVTGYTGGTTATVLRAREGTSGVAVSGAEWVHGPTAFDFASPVINVLTWLDTGTGLLIDNTDSVDNAAALTALLTYVETLPYGAILDWPSGTYQVSNSTGPVAQTPVVFLGNGEDLTTIKGIASGSAIQLFQPAYAGGITFDCNLTASCGLNMRTSLVGAIQYTTGAASIGPNTTYAGTDGVAVSTLTGTQSITCTSIPTGAPSSGTVLMDVNDGDLGCTATITYGSKSGNVLQNCTLVSTLGPCLMMAGNQIQWPISNASHPYAAATGTSSNGSPTLTGIASGAAWGMTVSGPGVPFSSGITVQAVSGTTVTLSADAGAGAGAGTFSFVPTNMLQIAGNHVTALQGLGSASPPTCVGTIQGCGAQTTDGATDNATSLSGYFRVDASGSYEPVYDGTSTWVVMVTAPNGSAPLYPDQANTGKNTTAGTAFNPIQAYTMGRCKFINQPNGSASVGAFNIDDFAAVNIHSLICQGGTRPAGYYGNRYQIELFSADVMTSGPGNISQEDESLNFLNITNVTISQIFMNYSTGGPAFGQGGNVSLRVGPNFFACDNIHIGEIVYDIGAPTSQSSTPKQVQYKDSLVAAKSGGGLGRTSIGTLRIIDPYCCAGPVYLQGVTVQVANIDITPGSSAYVTTAANPNHVMQISNGVLGGGIQINNAAGMELSLGNVHVYPAWSDGTNGTGLIECVAGSAPSGSAPMSLYCSGVVWDYNFLSTVANPVAGQTHLTLDVHSSGGAILNAGDVVTEFMSAGAFSQTSSIQYLGGYAPPGGQPSGIFDALDYGATGNGVTDDTAAILAAATAANAAGGGIVWLPAGVYITSASLFQYSHVTFKGAGIDATIIRASVSFTYAIQAFGTPSAQIVESGISDLTIDTQNVADADALLYQYVSFLRIERVKFLNCAYKCVSFGSLGRSNAGSPDGVLNSTITVTSASLNFTSADVGQPIYGTGIPAGTTIATRVSATTIHLSQAATASASGVLLAIGYTATENDHIFFTDCEFVDQNQVHPGNQEAITIGDVTVMRFTRCTWNTVYCAALAYQLADDISFDDCVVNGNPFYGFNLAISCKDITFRNTKVFGLGSSGDFALFTGSVSDNGLFASTTVNRVKTIGCRFTGGYGGMLLAAVNDFCDMGSTLDTNWTSGVVLETSGGGALSQNVRFVGTEFRNNNQSAVASNINAGVQFNTPGAQDFKAIGCVFTDDQASPTQLYPISFQGTGTAGTSIFTDVTVDGCTLTPYSGALSIGYVSAASLGARCKITNSPPYNPQAATTPTPSSGTALALASGLTTVPYDVQVMLTTVAGTLTSSVVVNGGTVTQPPAVAGVYSYNVPAGSTLTPTFTGTTPTCVVFPQ